jgi:hypothetical protein
MKEITSRVMGCTFVVICNFGIIFAHFKTAPARDGARMRADISDDVMSNKSSTVTWEASNRLIISIGSASNYKKE